MPFPVCSQARLVGSNTIPVATADVSPRPDGSFSCCYTAPASAGLHVLEVTYGGKHLGGSPFSVKVCTVVHYCKQSGPIIVEVARYTGQAWFQWQRCGNEARGATADGHLCAGYLL
jgi:hypothetical protein